MRRERYVVSPADSKPKKRREVSPERKRTYYHMIVENSWTGERREHISTVQGSVPTNPVGHWKCVGVCGFHEVPIKKSTPKSGGKNHDKLYPAAAQ